MKRFCRINVLITFILLLSGRFSVMAMTIITTDFSTMSSIQKSAEEIAMSKADGVDVFAVESDSLLRYLQLGKNGDVLVTSYKKLCEELAEKGLAGSFNITPIMEESMQCIKKDADTQDSGKVFIMIAGERHPMTESTLQEVSKQAGMEVFTLKKNEAVYPIVMDNLNKGMTVCGLESLFASLDVGGSVVDYTSMGIVYYACSLVGLHVEAYKTLLKYYETHNRLKN